MNLPITALILATSISANAAAPPKRPRHMTGAHLLAELRDSKAGNRLFDKPYALGYLAGVADSTEGRQWCVPAQIRADAVDQRILDYLESLPAAALADSASTLLIDQYRNTFPLTGAGCAVNARATTGQLASWASAARRKPGSGNAKSDMQAEEHARFADGYIGGTVDATQGHDWCAPPRIKPDELDAIAYWALVERPGNSDGGIAASFLHRALFAKYPCPPRP